VFASSVVIDATTAGLVVPELPLGVPLSALVPAATPDQTSIAPHEKSAPVQENAPVAEPGSPAATSCSHAENFGVVPVPAYL
jgi:hypothetical protein